jgi:leucyl aminopeptidase
VQVHSAVRAEQGLRLTTSGDTLLDTRPADSRPLTLLTEAAVPSWLAAQSAPVAAWVRAHGFAGERHRVLTLPAADGGVAGALLGLGNLPSLDELKLWHAAGLTERLPPGPYHVGTELPAVAATQLTLGWLVGGYRFARYRSSGVPGDGRAQLHPPAGADLVYARAAARGSDLARDLINTPAMDLGPAELAQAALDLALHHGAASQVITGEELALGFPLIHAVGAGSPRAPRLIDLTWGPPEAPRVTLIGKGVCFDTGGLDLKPSAAMLLMKKDMGGAACALGLAQMLMELAAPVRLRVLIPAVENSVDGAAYRPGDVLRSRKGFTVEIGNTDAEGRLVLADALTLADGERPALLVTLATLTGAARMALGPELPAAFSDDETLLSQLRRTGEEEADPVWPMPLWAGYEDELASKVADLGNVSASPHAGAIIAALFLKRFVSASPAFVHLDLFAWNARERPGRPVGAESQCVRSLYRLIRARHG